MRKAGKGGNCGVGKSQVRRIARCGADHFTLQMSDFSCGVFLHLRYGLVVDEIAFANYRVGMDSTFIWRFCLPRNLAGS